ncbi:MAG: hypothetical protein ACYDGR_03895 [Candidatus Dormibacteria bacterium]
MREAARAAAEGAAQAALAARALDRLQAEALPVAIDAVDDSDLASAARATLAGQLSAVTRSLLDGVNAAATELEDGESESELEELATMVAEVGGRLQQARRQTGVQGERPPEMYASERWRACLDEAIRHLKEARDQIDDGMPADAAAIEARAAARALERALG